MRIAIVLAIAYLFGSVLPAELFARSQGLDIRAIGTGNPGATNALRQLGFIPGVMTGLYDASVGLASMYLAWRLGLTEGWVYAAGCAAVLGHIFPLFSGFRGGQGMAAATGMLVWGIGRAVVLGLLGAPALAGLFAIAAVAFVLTRSASVVGVFAVPVFAAQLLFARPGWEFALFMSALGTLIWVTQLGMAREGRLFKLAEPVRQRVSRMRPHTR